MNVLLTSVGRRSYLVDYFKEAIKGSGKVIGANMYRSAAGMHSVDVPIVTPPASNSEYVPFLLDVCRRFDVNLLCSLHDLDVYILSQQRDRFIEAGVLTTLPNSEWGRITLDKWESTNVLAANGIDVPWTAIDLDTAFDSLSRMEIYYPLVVKARIGFGSLGLRFCHNEKELIEAFANAKEEVYRTGANEFITLPDDSYSIVQEAVTGREICLNVFNNFQGKYLSHFVCEVHEMRAGESDRATSLNRDEYENMARKLSKCCAHVANWGFDCLESENGPKVIDINPRFSGDYPFHHLAGANLPKALIQLANGQSPDPDCFVHNHDISMFKDLVPKAHM